MNKIATSLLRQWIRESIGLDDSSSRDEIFDEYEKRFKDLFSSEKVREMIDSLLGLEAEIDQVRKRGISRDQRLPLPKHAVFSVFFSNLSKIRGADISITKFISNYLSQIEEISYAKKKQEPKTLRQVLQGVIDNLSASSSSQDSSESARKIFDQMIDTIESRIPDAMEVIEADRGKLENVKSAQKAIFSKVDEKAGDLIIKIQDAESQISDLMSLPGMIEVISVLHQYDPPEKIADISGSDRIVFKLISAEMSPTEFRDGLSRSNRRDLENAELSGGDVRATAEIVLSNLVAMIDPLREISEIIQKDQDQIDKYAEAPAGSPLGRIAFATSRHGKPFELNTDLESELLDSITKHIEFNIKMTPQFFDLMKDLADRGLYKKVFTQPKDDVVYRGISVTKDWVTRGFDVDTLLQMRNDSLARAGSPEVTREQFLRDMTGDYDISFTLNPEGEGTSSWTAVESIAKSFTKAAIDLQTGMTDYRLVIKARIDDNPDSFINVSGSYLITNLAQYAGQKEYIGNGKIKCFAFSLIKLKGSDTALSSIPGQSARRSPERSKSK
jgi:hypothetical protein